MWLRGSPKKLGEGIEEPVGGSSQSQGSSQDPPTAKRGWEVVHKPCAYKFLISTQNRRTLPGVATSWTEVIQDDMPWLLAVPSPGQGSPIPGASFLRACLEERVVDT